MVVFGTRLLCGNGIFFLGWLLPRDRRGFSNILPVKQCFREIAMFVIIMSSTILGARVNFHLVNWSMKTTLVSATILSSNDLARRKRKEAAAGPFLSHLECSNDNNHLCSNYNVCE